MSPNLALHILPALAVTLAACARAPSPPPASPATAASPAGAADSVPPAAWPAKTYYKTIEVAGHTIFYREAGDPAQPTIVLLHGYPSSSHTYRELIPLLSGRYHVVAPDYLGSGFSDHPRDVTYTFDLLADYMNGFVDALGLQHYVLYLQDFGGPVGFRMALKHPDRLRGLIVQNANAYLDGLTPPRQAFFRRAHEDRSAEELAALQGFVSDDAIKNKQYLRDVPGPKQMRMSPDTWTHDIARMASSEDRAIQVQLFQDYQTNIDAYPSWQAFLRAHLPPMLIVWGEHDPAFIAAGAKAYLRDLPNAELHLLDAGHFAVEEQAVAIAQYIVGFMTRLEHAAPTGNNHPS